MSKQIRFEVFGTKCASCEIVIERTLKALPGVQEVHVSHSNGEVVLTVDKQVDVTPKQLKRALDKHNYRFRMKTEEEQTIELDPEKWNLKRIGGAAIVVFALYFVLQKSGWLTFSPTAEGPSSLLAVFGVGLIAAFSSCTAVVGGLVAAVSSASAKKNADQPFRSKIRPHALFNVGRIIGFIVFGAFIGWLGQAFQLSPTLNALFVLAIALLMVGIGVNLLEVLPKHVNVIRPPKWLSHKIHDLSNSSNPVVPFVLGAMTFFLPCGFTQSMQLYALSLGDPLQASIVMGIFALGTLPALFGIGALTSISSGATLKKVTRAAGVLVVVLGLSNVQNGFTLMGWDISRLTARAESVPASGPIVTNGEQIAQMEVTSYGTYAPDVLTVRAGVPVRWQVHGANQMGCGNTLVLRHFGVNESLRPGMNEIMFTPTKAGTYTFSCAMGMIRGTMIVLPEA